MFFPLIQKNLSYFFIKWLPVNGEQNEYLIICRYPILKKYKDCFFLMFSIATMITYQLPHFLVIILYLNMFRRKEVSVVWPGNLSCDFFFFLLTLKFVTSVIIKILNLVNNSNYQQVVILGYWMNIVHKVPQNSQNNFFKWISVFKGTAACRIERYIKHEAFPLGAASV